MAACNQALRAARLSKSLAAVGPNIYFLWGEKAARNAEDLAQEARILYEASRFARAYYLAHMAIEESAKSILLSAMDPAEPEKELKKMDRLLRDHKKKIEFVVSYAAELSPQLAHEIGELKPQLVAHMNDLKNSAMYVSLLNKKVLTPAEQLAEVNIRQSVSVAEALAGLAVASIESHSEHRSGANGSDRS